MIVLVHRNQKITEIRATNNELIEVSKYINSNLTQAFINLAQLFPKTLLVWIYADYVELLNTNEITKIFSNPLTLQSYSPTEVLPPAIGYVDQSPFINVNKQVKYPTWIMSDLVGGIHASVFNEIYNSSLHSNNFNQLMSVLAKLAQPLGLLCYSNPNLLKNTEITYINTPISLFEVVKKGYKTRWLFILLFNLCIYEKKVPLFNLFKGIFTSKAKVKANMEQFRNEKQEKLDTIPAIDVIIPTIGRAKYLEKVFELLALQTHIPNKVIIIEQNAIEGAPTELNFIASKKWPFKIEHQLIYQLGACNARNLALNQVESDYVFFADDDIEFENDLLEKALNLMYNLPCNALTIATYLEGQKVYSFNKNGQTTIFGSGCSIVKSNYLTHIRFDKAFEFGFGEDNDFGMQLRNIGCDILYTSDINILHLKAPIGGFRTKFIHPWQTEKVLPKPSPSVMLYNLKYLTTNQLLGYKTILFLKNYKNLNIRNPFVYVNQMNKRWNESLKWAKKISNI